METYVSFFRYTPEAWERMVRRPENRAVAARHLVESMGGVLEGYWWMLGQWHGMCVFRVPSTVTAAALNAGMLTSRVLAAVETHQLLDASAAEAALREAHGVRAGLAPPGGQDWYADYDAFVPRDT